jgi:hypothetical protein
MRESAVDCRTHPALNWSAAEISEAKYALYYHFIQPAGTSQKTKILL